MRTVKSWAKEHRSFMMSMKTTEKTIAKFTKKVCKDKKSRVASTAATRAIAAAARANRMMGRANRGKIMND